MVTRFKGSFKATPVMYINPVVSESNPQVRFLVLLQLFIHSDQSLFNCVPLELLQDPDLSHITIAPHLSSYYPHYLSPDWGKDEQRRVVWSRLQSQRSNLASRLSKQNEHYLALCQELNPRTTQAESSHDLLYRDSPATNHCFVTPQDHCTWFQSVLGQLYQGSQDSSEFKRSFKVTSPMYINLVVEGK